MQVIDTRSGVTFQQNLSRTSLQNVFGPNFNLISVQGFSLHLELGNGGIHIGINYLVLNEANEMNSDQNTEDFRLVKHLFNKRNICSKIGQIVTDL